MKKPFIIPIFIPQAGCPHQCVFCNQHHITGFGRTIPTKEEICQTINMHLIHKPKNRGKTQIAFFGGNFLGLPDNMIRFLLETVLPFTLSGDIDGIRCSTRPDTIDKDRLALIRTYPFSTIEIGAQSLNDEVLRISNRKHTASDTITAACLLKKYGYQVGIQMMVGLPGDDENTLQDSVKTIIDISPDFVRIYPTLVFSNSLLAQWYKSGRYKPLLLKKCVSLVKKIYLSFKENNIPVIRMGLQPTPETEKQGTLLAGPYHPSFGHMVYSEVVLDGIAAVLADDTVGTDLIIRSNPKNISIARGLKNQNIQTLIRQYGVTSVQVIPDNTLDKNTLLVNHRKIEI